MRQAISIIIIALFLIFPLKAQIHEATITIAIKKDTLSQFSLDRGGMRLDNSYYRYKAPVQISAIKNIDTLTFYAVGVSRIEGVSYEQKELRILDISFTRGNNIFLSSNGFHLQDSSSWYRSPVTILFADSSITFRPSPESFYFQWRLKQTVQFLPGDSVIFVAKREYVTSSKKFDQKPFSQNGYSFHRNIKLIFNGFSLTDNIPFRSNKMGLNLLGRFCYLPDRNCKPSMIFIQLQNP
jgi:hypothetical protein